METSCHNYLNQTLHHVLVAMHSFNANGQLNCYPGFFHNEMSDVLLNARHLLNSYIDRHNTWINYKYVK
jgi:hypothetical protein